MPQDEILLKLADRAKNGRKRLFHFLRDNYPALSKARADLGSTWSDIAALAGESFGKGARRPTADAVRKAWAKAEQDWNQSRPSIPEPSPAPLPTTRPAPPPVRPDAPRQDGHPRQFKPVSLKTLPTTQEA